MLENIASWDQGFEQPDGLRDGCSHITQSFPQGYAPTWPLWIKRYIENRVRVVLHIRTVSWEGNTVNLCAVFERQVAGPSRQAVGRRLRARMDMQVDVHSRSHEIEGVVLVLDVQSLQQPQGRILWRPVPSLVRLQRFDDGLCGCGHIVELLPPPIQEATRFRENREGSSSIGVCSGEAPRQVIESRPEVIEYVSNEHEQSVGRRVPIDDLCTAIAPWNILLCDNFVWADCQEIRDFAVQGLQVFVCPDQLHGESGYCRHD
jgi:hypothetical protein